ncbi:IS110 family transposase, partial [Streptomyces sp. NPDC056309]|uniref:IS110 family transposase n=1 Tax=Streptomyces sp. NPDC056309 TaxID=3345781 RepID=UPI0035E18B76
MVLLAVLVRGAVRGELVEQRGEFSLDLDDGAGLREVGFQAGLLRLQLRDITAQLAGIPLPEADGGTGRPRGAPGGTGEADPLSLVERLDEIPGIGPTATEVIVAELGPDMRVFPTSGHLVSWAKLAPRTIQSGGKNTSGPTG